MSDFSTLIAIYNTDRKALDAAHGEGDFADDCYQLMRYYNAQILCRIEAERALTAIRAKREA